MEGNFITNQDNKFLSEIISGILPKCDDSCFLVGYFYFSGFVELYEQLKNKNLRVLVGLDIERDMINRIREVDYHSTMNLTRAEARQSYFASLVDLFNETDYFDSQEQENAFKVFYEKIKDGTLQIRKTKEPNHAKMYLFENREDFSECGTYPGALITGSSNLSLSGLKGRWELNAILRAKSDYQEGKRIFEKLWEDAIIIADKDNISQFENGVIEKTWFEKLFSPYSFYLRVLHEYFSIDYDKEFKTAHDITDGKFLDLKYQADAIQMSLATIEKHNGVIVSDVVGLGKSIIASAVAHNLQMRTIIIAPPHLVCQWEEYRSEFSFNAKVFSSGSIEKALNYYREFSDNKKWLIIIDEAHKYRNEYTQDYFSLHQLCQGNKVMLLTATPFNNRPQDIYSMIRLFQIPSKSTLKTVDNLGREFRDLIKQYKELTKEQKDGKLSDVEIKKQVEIIAGRIRAIISPLVIRRSRLDLRGISSYKADLKKQKIDFADMSDPELLEYPLGKMRDLYLETLNLISLEEKNTLNDQISYKAARYQPVTYVKKERKEHLKKKIEEAGFEYNLFMGAQRNLSKFMRHLLVRRDAFIETSILQKRPIPVSVLREETVSKYPYWATRELLMNSVMHRDYETNAPVLFYEYDDRIEVQNPGGLYGKVHAGNFPNVSDYRNPFIAEAMKILGYVNRFSRGVYRVQKELKENGNDEATFDFSLITAFRVIEKVSEKYFEEGFGADTTQEKGNTTQETPKKHPRNTQEYSGRDIRSNQS